MIWSRKPIELAGLTPLAHGNERLIYDHPTRKRRLLKVIVDRREVLTQPGPRGALTRRFEVVRNRFMTRELTAYLHLMTRETKPTGPPPVARIFGFVETDLGPAFEVERITFRDRAVGPTLSRTHLAGNLTDTRLAALNRFVAAMDDWRVRATDLNPRNIVYGRRNGEWVFVLVDGLGDYRTLPLASWSDRANRWLTGRAYAALAPRLDLRWDAGERVFRRRGPS